CQARDLKNLYIMLAKTIGNQRETSLASAFKQTDYQCDASTIDIIHLAEIEQKHLRLLVGCFIIGSIKHIFSECINFALQIDNSSGRLVSNRCSETAYHHSNSSSPGTLF